MGNKLRDKKIVIYRQYDTAAPGEMPKVVYHPIHSGKIWAYVRQTSADEVFNSAGEYSRESMMFEIAWRNDFASVGYYVEYKGVFYDIKRIDTYEGYKHTLVLTCDKSQTQPKSEDIKAY